MREWLEYHLLVGVGHFFLFPNDCDADSGTRKLLVPKAAGVVTVDGEFDCAKELRRGLPPLDRALRHTRRVDGLHRPR